MEYIKLKNSDLIVSRFCMGGCPLGGHGWGETQEELLLSAIQEAVNQGVTFFDTADTYGLGKSEELLGAALSSVREKVIIATKFGVRVENGKTIYDNSPEWIREAVQNSLKRLGTEYIDLYQLHYRDNTTPIDSVVATLEELKSEGLIRYYGLSNIHERDYEDLIKHKGKFVSFQDEYSLANRRNESVLKDLSVELSLTPMTWGSLGQGILTGKYDENVTFDSSDRRSRDIYVNFHGDKLLHNLEIVKVLREISEETGKSIAAVAIRFILDNIKDSVVLAGVKNPSQLKSNIEAMGWSLSKSQIDRLLEISKQGEKDYEK